MLTDRYLKRIRLRRENFDNSPTLENLKRITEAHLENIPFDNLAQHGGKGGPATLDVAQLAEKLLDRQRGGFCYEVNGLLAEWLVELGYGVLRVPSYVHIRTEQGFRPGNSPGHIGLIVTLPRESSRFYVDVGFGEPAINPLKYEMDVSQETAEGMISRFVHDGDDVVLERLDHETNLFYPRLHFEAKDAALAGDAGPSLADFAKNMEIPLHHESVFSKKLIVTRLTRERKITVAGDQFKQTGPPRFGMNSCKTIYQLHSAKDLRRVLKEDFGIPMIETREITLAKSQKAPKGMWGQL